MASVNKVFDETYNNYLKQLADLDLKAVAGRLGLEGNDTEMQVVLLGEKYSVSPRGILDADGARAGFSQCIVIFKSLLMAPEQKPADNDWAAYHSFKDAQPLLGFFAREVTGPIENRFAGKLSDLESVSQKLGGKTVSDEAAFDLSIEFSLMPAIPLFLRFNDADEDFPAQCTILFRESIETYLDMESVGVLAALFARRLIG